MYKVLVQVAFKWSEIFLFELHAKYSSTYVYIRPKHIEMEISPTTVSKEF
jgi:hypothetical protein